MGLIQRTGERYVWLTVCAVAIAVHFCLIAAACWMDSCPIALSVKSPLRVQMRTPTAQLVTASTLSLPATAVQATSKVVKVDSTAKESRKMPAPPAATCATPLPEVSSPPATKVEALKSVKNPVKAATPPALKVAAASASKGIVKAAPPATAATVPANASISKDVAKAALQAAAKRQLLERAQQNLAQLTPAVAKLTTSVSADEGAASMSTAVELPSSAAAAAVAHSYEEVLAAHLRYMLCLPEHGTVSLALTLDRQGHVVTFAILAATSARNSAYIQSALPQLQLPIWPTYLSLAEEYTLQFTLASANTTPGK